MTNPDHLLHAFRTFLGIVPDSDDPPVCGAELTSAYDGRQRSPCPACAAIMRAAMLAERPRQEPR